MKKIILVNGLISGTIVSTFMLVSMGLFACGGSGGSMVTSMIVGFASMFAAFIFVFIGTKQYREKVNEGVLPFGTAFKVGTLIALIGSTMYVISWMIDFQFFLPDFMNRYSESMIKNYQASGLTAADLQIQIDHVKQSADLYNNNFFYRLFATYMEIFPVGIISALISALILKRKKKIALA
jgi:hypothetical protein